VRPTSDRVREAVFSSLESLRGGAWSGAAALDLYAGSGALGLEALSRGADRVDLVESDHRAVRVIEANVSVVAPTTGEAHVHTAAVERWVVRPPVGVRFDVVFCDPPYALPAEPVAEALSSLRDAGALADAALVVVERSRRDAWSWPEAFHPLKDRRYGEAHVWMAHV
jgi:16S rRNA (guanine966-N2)-methyltransferase